MNIFYSQFSRSCIFHIKSNCQYRNLILCMWPSLHSSFISLFFWWTRSSLLSLLAHLLLILLILSAWRRIVEISRIISFCWGDLWYFHLYSLMHLSKFKLAMLLHYSLSNCKALILLTALANHLLHNLQPLRSWSRNWSHNDMLLQMLI